jgi:hypothetical protein
MVRKSLLVASLATLALVTGRPASAAPTFLEPYADIFGARTFLASPTDKRPKDVLQTQPSKKENPERRFLVHGFARDNDRYLLAGGGVGYADVSRPNNPWSVNVSIFNMDPDGPGRNEVGWDITGKLVLWTPDRDNLPVVSVIGRFIDLKRQVERFDILLAADQKITDDLYLTVNLGYGHNDFDVRGVPSVGAFVPGFGATYRLSPRLSVSGNYTARNAAEVFHGRRGEDFWSAAATYTIDRNFAVRAGGGKHNTVFAQLIGKWE